MISDELQGHVADVLELPLGRAETAAALLSRVHGAPLAYILAAALVVAREQAGSEIADLKRALRESVDARFLVEIDLHDLRAGLKNLLANDLHDLRAGLSNLLEKFK